MTDVHNGFILASCGYYIRSVGRNNGSVSQATTYCVTHLVTDKNDENPREVVISSTETTVLLLYAYIKPISSCPRSEVRSIQ